MKLTRMILILGLISVAWQGSANAQVACAGGTLDIQHTSDLPFTGTTFNVGQKVTVTVSAVGFTPSTVNWVIAGPLIKDYEERIGTVPTGSISWGTTPLTGADTSSPSVSFYWKPAPGQIHPLNTGPDTRNVTLTVVTATSITCTLTKSFQVERNATNLSKQAEDYYTSNHKAATEPNPEKGLIIDDHTEWHTVSPTRLLAFLPWHREFISRFDSWRAEFGYPAVVPWYPGTPLPTGPDIDHSPRLGSYNPVANRIPTWFTIAGGSAIGPLGAKRLADFATLTNMSNSLEGSWHGTVHCNIGPNAFAGMCNFSSPKDPIFFRWHKFIDLVYMNYCGLKGLACAPGGPLPTDTWMGDNPADIASNGAPPSPTPHWISPDIWNRTSLAACTPSDAAAGVVRDCGSTTDHENPIEGVQNFLYATLRNDRPGANLSIYAEVAVYISNASTGLAWPTNFGGPPDGVPLPETRQFITLNLAPGQQTDIGPLPWVPPSPIPSDHFCLYIRVLSVQDAFGIAEGANVDANTGGSNSISWRNIKIVSPVPAPMPSPITINMARFTVRNLQRERAPIDLEVRVPPDMMKQAQVELILSPQLEKAWRESQGKVEGLTEPPVIQPNRPTKRGQVFLVSQPSAALRGVVLAPQQEAAATIRVTGATRLKPFDILIEQKSRDRSDGGILLQVRPSRRPLQRRLTRVKPSVPKMKH